MWSIRLQPKHSFLSTPFTKQPYLAVNELVQKVAGQFRTTLVNVNFEYVVAFSGPVFVNHPSQAQGTNIRSGLLLQLARLDRCLC